MDTAAQTPPLTDRFDTATLALHHIHSLAGIHVHHMLKPEEVSILCELIYEASERALQQL